MNNRRRLLHGQDQVQAGPLARSPNLRDTNDYGQRGGRALNSRYRSHAEEPRGSAHQH